MNLKYSLANLYCPGINDHSIGLNEYLFSSFFYLDIKEPKNQDL